RHHLAISARGHDPYRHRGRAGNPSGHEPHLSDPGLGLVFRRSPLVGRLRFCGFRRHWPVLWHVARHEGLPPRSHRRPAARIGPYPHLLLKSVFGIWIGYSVSVWNLELWILNLESRIRNLEF